jgi:hypothetical protein
MKCTHVLDIHVRRASDWKPLAESALRAVEERHAGLVALQLFIGAPRTPVDRADRLLVASDDDPMRSWEMRFGIRKTPTFLVVDAEGRLRGVSQGLEAAERMASSPASGSKHE